MKKLLLLFLTFCLVSCAGNPPTKVTIDSSKPDSLSRANPAYIQWLMSQSFLEASKAYVKVLANNALQLSFSSTLNNSSLLLDKADMWLECDISRYAGGANAFNSLERNLQNIKNLGFKGIMLTNSQENGSIWAYEKNSNQRNSNTISYNFSTNAGDIDAYNRLYAAASQAQMQLGSNIVSAATGLGTDFMLAARNSNEYIGTYFLVEIAPDHWQLLPEIKGEWEVKALSDNELAEFSKLGYVPSKLSNDFIPLNNQNFWAATGKIVGEDGVTRRYIYRYYTDPSMPVLNFDNPSQFAKRILSTSVLKEVGIERKSLVSLSVEAFMGLDSAEDTLISFEPAVSAAKMLNRQIRTYGGFSMLNDNIPMSLLPIMLDLGIDFVPDSILSPSLEYALISGDLTNLNSAINLALMNNIEQKRIWRTLSSTSLNSFNNVDFAYLPELMQTKKYESLDFIKTLVSKNPNLHYEDHKLYASLFDLANLVNPKYAKDIMQMFVTIKAAQPGILAINIEDMLYVPYSENSGYTFGNWNNEMARHILSIARMRELTKIAHGKMQKSPANINPQVFCTLTKLPNGNSLLLVANISDSNQQTTVYFENKIKYIYNLLDNTQLNPATSKSINLEFAPYSAKIFLIE